MKLPALVSSFAVSALLVALSPSDASAAGYWQTGHVLMVRSVGTTLDYKLLEYPAKACTCGGWGDVYCLNPTRPDYRIQIALLTQAMVSNQVVTVRIDDVTCLTDEVELGSD